MWFGQCVFFLLLSFFFSFIRTNTNITSPRFIYKFLLSVPCLAARVCSYLIKCNTREETTKKNESKLSHRQTTMSKTTKWEVEKKTEREKAYTHENRNETSVQQRASKTRKSSDIVNEMRRKKRGKGNKSRAKKNKADKMLDLLSVCLCIRIAQTHTHTHKWARARARSIENAREMAIAHGHHITCNDYDNWVCINTCLLLYERAQRRSIYLFTLICTLCRQATGVNCAVCTFCL